MSFIPLYLKLLCVFVHASSALEGKKQKEPSAKNKKNLVCIVMCVAFGIIQLVQKVEVHSFFVSVVRLLLYSRPAQMLL